MILAQFFPIPGMLLPIRRSWSIAGDSSGENVPKFRNIQCSFNLVRDMEDRMQNMQEKIIFIIAT